VKTFIEDLKDENAKLKAENDKLSEGFQDLLTENEVIVDEKDAANYAYDHYREENAKLKAQLAGMQEAGEKLLDESANLIADLEYFESGFKSLKSQNKEACRLLKLILAELESDPRAVQYFDLLIVEQSKKLLKEVGDG